MFVYSFDKLNATTGDILSEIERIPCKVKLEETHVSWLYRIERIERCHFPTFVQLYLIQFFRTYENSLFVKGNSFSLISFVLVRIENLPNESFELGAAYREIKKRRFRWQTWMTYPRRRPVPPDMWNFATSKSVRGCRINCN